MATPLRFVRFGRKPTWVSYGELIGIGDGAEKVFPLPAGASQRQRITLYLAGLRVAPDAKTPEVDLDGKKMTRVVDGITEVLYKRQGWSLVKRSDGLWAAFDEAPGPNVPITISRIFSGDTIVDVATGKRVTDAPCFKFGVFTQAEFLELLAKQPAPDDAESLMSDEEKKEHEEKKAQRWKGMSLESRRIEKEKELGETVGKTIRDTRSLYKWTTDIFNAVVISWANIQVETEDGGAVELPFNQENVDAFLGRYEGASEDAKESGLAVGSWAQNRLQDVIAFQNAKTGDLAGN